MYSSDVYAKALGALVIPLGVNDFNEAHVAELAKLPHLLIGGTTGTSKSIFLHSILTSTMQRYSPDQVRFLMVDPKRVELTLYDEAPHLLAPVITSPDTAVSVLNWLGEEMDRRCDLLQDARSANIVEYNKKETGQQTARPRLRARRTRRCYGDVPYGD